MKRFIVAGCALAFFAGSMVLPVQSSAQGYNTNTGCGLGNQLFQEIGQDSILFQVLAVTTNGILGNQTFGITSGTLGCSKPTKIVKNERMEKFVAANMDTLAQDIATGNGEALDALAELMAVPAVQRDGFYALLQANFTNIYTSEKIQSSEVIDKIADIASRS